MKDLCELIDKYAKISYVVRRLNARINKLPEFLFSVVNNCDYSDLGLDDDTVASLLNSTTGAELLEQYDKLYKIVDSMIVRIYDEIYHLSFEEKNELYDYLNERATILSQIVEVSQKSYDLLVARIEQAGKNQESDKIISLGKQATVEKSKVYELDSIKMTYVHLGCYMSSMVKRKK
jgi:hypothetical protein